MAAGDAVLAIDQGTTNSKAVLVDSDGQIVGSGSVPVGLNTPAPGWVEQSGDRIWKSVVEAIGAALNDSRARIAGICLSTQRESVIAWDSETGRPFGPVIGWQDRRTASWCATALDPSANETVRARTGLQVDAMFSAPKIRWLLDNLPANVTLANVRVGTIDSWLLWNLTGGRVHACEAGNASRTLLFDVLHLEWSPELLDAFGIPRAVLPSVQASRSGFGSTSEVPGIADGTPIVAIMADSHAALYGQGCTRPGMTKATYGTGSSVMTPVEHFVAEGSGVPATLAWVIDSPTYAREGNILSSGAALAWTASLLTGGNVGNLISLAATVPDSGGASLVPAFSGLGAPHWNRDATALICGMTNGTTAAHLARAAVDAVANQICDIVDTLEADDVHLATFRADGGVTVSDLAMQVQADLLGHVVEVADVAEISALGVAQLGWQSLADVEDWSQKRGRTRSFSPGLDPSERARRRALWSDAVRRAEFAPPPPTVASLLTT